MPACCGLLRGITLGLAMAIHPAWVVYRPAHAHMNLVGFVVMMIFGVGYQMLPRFFGHPIHSRSLAVAHVWMANPQPDARHLPTKEQDS